MQIADQAHSLAPAEATAEAPKALQALHVKNLERRLVIINALAGELTSTPTLNDPVAGRFHPKDGQ